MCAWGRGRVCLVGSTGASDGSAKMNTGYIRNLKSTLIVAEHDACQNSCQNKCWRCTPHRVVSLKHTFVYMSIWNFLLCHSLLHPQLQDTQQFIVHAMSSHPCQAEMTKTGVEFYYDRVPRGMEVWVHLIISQTTFAQSSHVHLKPSININLLNLPKEIWCWKWTNVTEILDIKICKVVSASLLAWGPHLF